VTARARHAGLADPRGVRLAALAAATLGWACASTPAPRATAPVAEAVEAPVRATCGDHDPEALAVFPDANLQLAVRRAIGLAQTQDLTCGALLTLRSLHAPDARIQDLAGIAALVHLEELYIYGNNSITDVAPLVGLTTLRDLNLARNRIEDIGPLAELTGLTSLSLYGNPIRDISPLAALTGLTRLQVDHAAALTDLSALSGLHRLTRLELSGNEIVDLGPLAGLTALTRLSLEDNVRLTDLGPLARLTQLETLVLSGTGVRDLAPLGALERLRTLVLVGTPVQDLGALIGLGQLAQLDLSDNPALTDIQPLLFNPELGRGDAVRLDRTGVACEDVAALRVKGVSVLSSC